MSNMSSTRQFADGISITNWVPKPVDETTDAQVVQKPKKKKNRGGKKAKHSKVALSIDNISNNAHPADTNTEPAENTTAEPASTPLGKTAKRAEKAAKAARAAQIAAAAQAMKMGVSVSIDETDTASDDASSSPESSEQPLAVDASQQIEDTSASADVTDVAEDTKSSSEVADVLASEAVDASSSTEAYEELAATSEDGSSSTTASSSHSDAANATHTPESLSVFEDAASASGDVNEASESMPFDTSEDVAFGFGNNATFDFGHDSFLETGNAAFSGVPEPININDVLSNFGRAFSPMAPAFSHGLPLETGVLTSSDSTCGVVASPLPPKVYKATSFANDIRKKQQQQDNQRLLDGSKLPRGMIPVKLNRKPLTEASKKDHQESNPFFQTLVKNSSTDPICAEAVRNLQAKFDVTLPRKPVKKASKPLKIDYYPPVDGTFAGNAIEFDDIVDVDMIDATSFTGAEDIADETVAATTTDAEDASERVDIVEPVLDTAKSAPSPVDQADEAISEHSESTHFEDEQQDEPTVQDTTEIAEQTPETDPAEVISDETAALHPSRVLSETMEPTEEVVVDMPQVCDLPAITVFKFTLDFLAFPNAAMYPPVLSLETEQAVIDMHITPLYLQELPGAVEKMTRAEKKAAKSSKTSPVDDAPSAAVLKSELAFLSFYNAAEYRPSLSREAELFLIDSHVTPLHLQKAPGAVKKPAAPFEKASKKAAKAEKKAAKAEKKAAKFHAAEEASSEPIDEPSVEQDTTESADATASTCEGLIGDISSPMPDNVSEDGSESSSESSPDEIDIPAPEEFVAPSPIDEDTFVADLLAMPNGLGKSLEARQFEETMVALHVASLVLPLPQTPSKKSRAEKKAKKNAAEFDVVVQADDAARSREATPAAETSASSSLSSPSTQERVAIEMGHTFLGITRLSRFLAALSMSPDYTVTKDALCTTFRSFATAECRILLGRVPAYIGSELDNVGVQCKTMLGDTSLYEFLQAVQWTYDESTMEEIARVFTEKAVEGEAFDAQMQPIVNRIAMG